MKTLLLSSMLAVLAGPAWADGPSPEKTAAPPASAIAEVYKVRCQVCHMADGNSPLEPMNFADGKWKNGSTRAEVVKVISEGVPATAMLPFKEQLSAAEITQLAAYVRAFDPSLKAPSKGKKPAPKGSR